MVTLSAPLSSEEPSASFLVSVFIAQVSISLVPQSGA
jgi:hypothetical protein